MPTIMKGGLLMFFDPFILVFSFCVGILGAMFGGIQTFICTGFAGVIIYVLQAAGLAPGQMGDLVLNTLLLPAIIFNGAAVATAVAARKYPEIKGWDITKSLIFTHDPLVMLIGGCAGSLGYLLFSAFTYLNLPTDAGSLAIVICGVIVRLTLSEGRRYNPDATAYYKKEGIRYWVFQTINYLAVSIVFALLLKEAGPAYYGMGFNISALLLIFGYAGGGQKVPTTHQITCILGTALGLTSGNIFVAVLFGWISNMIYLLFARYFNEDCSTHIDPPAVAIAVVTMLLKVFF